jgi:hypothetical protein
MCSVEGVRTLASDQGSESGGLPVIVQWTLGALSGGPLRRLQQLADVLRGRCPHARERRRRLIRRAASHGAMDSATEWECPGLISSIDVTGERHQEGAATNGEGHEVHDLDLRLATGLRRHGR